MDKTLFSIRRFKDEDKAFVAHSIYWSWIKSPKNINRSIHSLNHKINFILDKCIIRVVCLSEDEDNIVGFIAVQPCDPLLIIHTVYTRAPFRRLGIATELLRLTHNSFAKVATSLNLIDEDLLLPKMKNIFSEVIDMTSAWKPDREVTRKDVQ